MAKIFVPLNHLFLLLIHWMDNILTISSRMCHLAASLNFISDLLGNCRHPLEPINANKLHLILWCRWRFYFYSNDWFKWNTLGDAVWFNLVEFSHTQHAIENRHPQQPYNSLNLCIGDNFCRKLHSMTWLDIILYGINLIRCLECIKVFCLNCCQSMSMHYKSNSLQHEDEEDQYGLNSLRMW